MKSKILETFPLSEYPEAKYLTENSPVIYIADFSERTKGLKKGEGRREVEIHSANPLTPDGTASMDCLKLINKEQLSIDFCIFDNHQFKRNGKEKDDEHCECCFFPTESHETPWVSFVEIKDCKPKNIASYKDKVKEQIISTVGHFKGKGILNKREKIYGIISFPRRTKIDFNDFILGTPQDIFDMRKKYGILFLAANTVNVTSKDIAL